MATYDALVAFYGTDDFDDLRNRVKVAIAIKAVALANLTPPTQNQIDYAIKVIYDLNAEATAVINYVIASNKNASIATLIGATDENIQNNVDEAIDELLSITLA